MNKTSPDRWEVVVGFKPHRVTVFEDRSRGGVATLRWHVPVRGADGRIQNKRTLEALGFAVRGNRGSLDKEAVARATAAASEKYARLVRGETDDAPPPPASVAMPTLTIREGWARACDPDTGRWPKDTSYRRTVDRAITQAVAAWGPGAVWAGVDRGRIRKLWRWELARLRARGHQGVRGAELTVACVLAVGAWLRDEQLIPLTAALRWERMDEEFNADAGDYQPARPRYTLAEYRALFAAAWQADERFGLLYALGAEFRAVGQVRLTYRRHLHRAVGRLYVPGRGKKLGATIRFTAQQRTDVERVLTTGYLAGLEAAYVAGEVQDYPLFPGGHFAHGPDGALVSRAEYATRPPVDRTAPRAWHRAAEQIAGIPHVRGRGMYGSRRQGVDAALEAGISRPGMKAHGGWGDDQTPNQVYANAEAEYAQDEAARIRARIRGEAVDDTVADRIVWHVEDLPAARTLLAEALVPAVDACIARCLSALLKEVATLLAVPTNSPESSQIVA